MKGKIIVLFLIIFFTTISSGFCATRGVKLTPGEVDEYTFVAQDLVINNFIISEETAYLTDEMSVIRISFAAKNKGNKTSHFTVMVSGYGPWFDSSPGDKESEFLWAADLSPLMSILSAHSNEIMEKRIYVPKGTLKRTNLIVLKINGDFVE